jgi:hypothetical protein
MGLSCWNELQGIQNGVFMFDDQNPFASARFD